MATTAVVANAEALTHIRKQSARALSLYLESWVGGLNIERALTLGIEKALAVDNKPLTYEKVIYPFTIPGSTDLTVVQPRRYGYQIYQCTWQLPPGERPFDLAEAPRHLFRPLASQFFKDLPEVAGADVLNWSTLGPDASASVTLSLESPRCELSYNLPDSIRGPDGCRPFAITPSGLTANCETTGRHALARLLNTRADGNGRHRTRR